MRLEVDFDPSFCMPLYLQFQDCCPLIGYQAHVLLFYCSELQVCTSVLLFGINSPGPFATSRRWLVSHIVAGSSHELNIA